MTEENQTQEESSEEQTNAVKTETDGDTEPTLSLVERADSAVKRLIETEKRVSERIKKLEELETRRVLGGKSDVGDPKKEKTTDEIIDEEVSKAVSRFA